MKLSYDISTLLFIFLFPGVLYIWDMVCCVGRGNKLLQLT